MLSVDANFRLKLKARGLDDVALLGDWGYYVNEVGYTDYVKLHASDVEVRFKYWAGYGDLYLIIRLITVNRTSMLSITPIRNLEATKFRVWVHVNVLVIRSCDQEVLGICRRAKSMSVPLYFLMTTVNY